MPKEKKIMIGRTWQPVIFLSDAIANVSKTLP
jgi:hypothetical protein